jgi:hypothetical protein
MTDLQDAICDRLAAATITRDWANGPLHVAAGVIDPQFELAENEYNRRQSQLIARMNWPRLFCMAFHGANAALASEEDRRTLAIHLFQQIEPRSKQGRVSRRKNCEVACWAAVHVHPLACSAECPLHQGVAPLADDYRSGKEPSQTRLNQCKRLLRRCPSFSDPDRAVRFSSPPAHHALVAYRYLIEALKREEVIQAGDCTRESARTAAKVRGVPGGVEVCLEIARQLGLC